jgi:predicted enzyme related to lactoylglutathione lyase
MKFLTGIQNEVIIKKHCGSIERVAPILRRRYQMNFKNHTMKTAKKTKPKKMDPVVHFEMPSEDSKRMSKFYSKAFGWETKMLGPETGNYVLASTSASFKNGHPKKPGMINGGFYTKSKEMPAQYPSVVIAVENIKDAMKKVSKAGGEVIGEPMEIPGFGWYVSFYDTEGNRVSMMEPFMD